MAINFLISAAFIVTFAVVLYLFWRTARMVRAWWSGGDWQAELRKGSNAALAYVAAGMVAMSAIWIASL